ncbi:DUF6912 family protein [uncultured Friedmanniella sp.]|uniref:DUF6912 family protein n=1 Tax=uncultured Friedmanniella sp. TaxID=335381 RepID=UPI0035CB6EAA
MVFVPMPFSAAVVLRGGRGPSVLQGFAATPSLLAGLGSDAGDEADYAALNAAGVAALEGLTGPRRLILAVEAAAQQVLDARTELGEVRVEAVRWDQVRALFADGPEAAPAVAAAAEAAAGVALDRVLELPAVVELGETIDLLWYATGELDDLG